MWIAMLIAAALVAVYGAFAIGMLMLNLSTERQRKRFRERGVLTMAEITNSVAQDDRIVVEYAFLDTPSGQRFSGKGCVAALPPRDPGPSQIEVIYVADDPQTSAIATSYFQSPEIDQLRQRTSER